MSEVEADDFLWHIGVRGSPSNFHIPIVMHNYLSRVYVYCNADFDLSLKSCLLQIDKLRPVDDILSALNEHQIRTTTCDDYPDGIPYDCASRPDVTLQMYLDEACRMDRTSAYYFSLQFFRIIYPFAEIYVPLCPDEFEEDVLQGFAAWHLEHNHHCGISSSHK